MSNKQNFLTLSAATLVAGFLAITMLTAGAEASVTSNLMNCASNNRAKTIDCCESVVRGAVPLWMKTTGRNCEKVVKCSGGSGNYPASTAAPVSKKRCKILVYVEDVPNEGGGGDRQPPGNRNPGRTPNIR